MMSLENVGGYIHEIRYWSFGMQTHPELSYTHPELYANTLSQVKLAEDVGFDSAWISEHHFLEDGYCPSPAVIAGAMAAVTSTIRIGSSGIILPLHNPVRVAEDAAVVDNIFKRKVRSWSSTWV